MVGTWWGHGGDMVGSCGETWRPIRCEFMSKTFKAQSGPTQIIDLVRQMDVGLSKYRKLIDALPQNCHRTGLDLQRVDLMVMLLSSLPGDVKNYVVLHASGEGYTDYRAAALK
eukprot:s3881_g6.t1